ncbi:hypothetical protein AVEN_150061-1 [Araneus ventricosus]|uniref:Uncharacterized protein n=1 Tax=Araneus ventricosus TaxID=182803 RepID=A0A4Y2EV62_ARAVE|nr:hypothetical protein AVEN_150061-1 [Araneus ventricosus]
MTVVVETKHRFPGKQASKACSSTLGRSSVELAPIERALRARFEAGHCHCSKEECLETVVQWDKASATEPGIRLGRLFKATANSCFGISQLAS